MTIYEIVEAWLKTNGYDGLYVEDCGCVIGELCPCGAPWNDCEPGYNHGPEHGGDFSIYPAKKEGS